MWRDGLGSQLITRRKRKFDIVFIGRDMIGLQQQQALRHAQAH